jgi:hypothetical protein
VFYEESYSVFPSKINKDNFEKNHKKNHVGKHYRNPLCFVRKTTMLSSHDLALLYKDNFEKKIIIKNKKKTKWGKYYRNPQCFKEKNYKAKFLTSSILKK